jgi:hypothetical protein
MRSRDGSGRDDALIEVLATRSRLPAEHLDDELALVLAAWVDQLDCGLVQCPPTAAVPSLPAGPDRIVHRRSRRVAVTVAVAATMLVVIFASGVTVTAKARPGDPLWGVSRLVNPGRAASLEARQLADSALRLAEDDLAHGRYAQARQRLADARARLAAVRGPDGQADLADRVAALERRLAGTRGGAVNAAPRQPGGGPTRGGSEPATPSRQAPAPGPAQPPPTDPPADATAPGGNGPPDGTGGQPGRDPGGGHGDVGSHGTGADTGGDPGTGDGGTAPNGATAESGTTANSVTADGGTTGSGVTGQAGLVAGTGSLRLSPAATYGSAPPPTAGTSGPARHAASSGGSGRSCSTVSRETARVNAT